MPFEVVEDGGWEEEEAITCGVDMSVWVSWRNYKRENRDSWERL
jgi:hypothetical protein